MSIYFPQYVQFENDDMPNCMCGDKGKNRNERECKRRGGCQGCGFDIGEYNRRISVIRSQGLSTASDAYKAQLLKEWGVDIRRSIQTLKVGTKEQRRKVEEGA